MKYQTLGERFNKVQEEVLKGSSDVSKTMELLEGVLRDVIAARVFSPNETIEDIATEDIKYASLPYLMGEAMLQLPETDPDVRKENLGKANSLFGQFVKHCQALEIVDKEEEKLFKHLIASNKEDRLTSVELREMKIRAFRLKKERGEFVDRKDRDFIIKEMQVYIRSSLSTIAMNLQEIQMLEFAKGKNNIEKTDLPSKKPTVYRITKDHKVEPLFISRGIDEVVKGKVYRREEVFRNRNPHTMSLDEFAEREMDRMKEREAKPAQVSESDSEDEEKATLKARHWDNWKDDHEKGLGNRAGR